MEKQLNESTQYNFVQPEHYRKGSREVWQMMVDIWGVDAFKLFCEMNAFKYRMRLGSKPNESVDQDLEKAKWYEAKINELK
jgi:hypothetical protein